MARAASAPTTSSLHEQPAAYQRHRDKQPRESPQQRLLRIVIRAQKVKGHIRLSPHHPAVVRDLGNVKKLARRSSKTRPSSSAAVAVPDTTSPTCATVQSLAPTVGPTCSDHRHPGS